MHSFYLILLLGLFLPVPSTAVERCTNATCLNGNICTNQDFGVDCQCSFNRFRGGQFCAECIDTPNSDYTVARNYMYSMLPLTLAMFALVFFFYTTLACMGSAWRDLCCCCCSRTEDEDYDEHYASRFLHKSQPMSIVPTGYVLACYTTLLAGCIEVGFLFGPESYERSIEHPGSVDALLRVADNTACQMYFLPFSMSWTLFVIGIFYCSLISCLSSVGLEHATSKMAMINFFVRPKKDWDDADAEVQQEQSTGKGVELIPPESPDSRKEKWMSGISISSKPKYTRIELENSSDEEPENEQEQYEREEKTQRQRRRTASMKPESVTNDDFNTMMQMRKKKRLYQTTHALLYPTSQSATLVICLSGVLLAIRIILFLFQKFDTDPTSTILNGRPCCYPYWTHDNADAIYYSFIIMVMIGTILILSWHCWILSQERNGWICSAAVKQLFNWTTTEHKAAKAIMLTWNIFFIVVLTLLCLDLGQDIGAGQLSMVRGNYMAARWRRFMTSETIMVVVRALFVAQSLTYLSFAVINANKAKANIHKYLAAHHHQHGDTETSQQSSTTTNPSLHHQGCALSPLTLDQQVGSGLLCDDKQCFATNLKFILSSTARRMQEEGAKWKDLKLDKHHQLYVGASKAIPIVAQACNPRYPIPLPIQRQLCLHFAEHASALKHRDRMEVYLLPFHRDPAMDLECRVAMVRTMWLFHFASMYLKDGGKNELGVLHSDEIATQQQRQQQPSTNTQPNKLLFEDSDTEQ